VEYWAEFGPTTAYGSQTAHQSLSAAQGSLVSVSAAIQGLQRSTSYHFRFCAQDSSQKGGPGCGADRQFTTQPAGCGETVTTDIVLTGDLDCPQQPGFVIGADGVDIDLARHSMAGGIAVGGGGPNGIDNTAGFDDLTVRNGVLEFFGYGVVIHDGSRNRILSVTSRAAGNAVVIEGGADNEVRHANLFGRSQALVATDSARLIVADTHAESAFGGAIVVSADFARLARNDVPSNSDRGRLKSGVQLVGNDGRVTDNNVTGGWTGGGIVVAGSRNAIVGNHALGGVFPLLDVTDPAIGDGIFVTSFSSGTLLRANRADGNAGDGIETRSIASLGDNAASTNGDFGIDAASGSTDLGGNTASDNGNPLQCRNVFCP
jgi:hypothetical protein